MLSDHTEDETSWAEAQASGDGTPQGVGIKIPRVVKKCQEYKQPCSQSHFVTNHQNIQQPSKPQKTREHPFMRKTDPRKKHYKRVTNALPQTNPCEQLNALSKMRLGAQGKSNNKTAIWKRSH